MAEVSLVPKVYNLLHTKHIVRDFWTEEPGGYLVIRQIKFAVDGIGYPITKMMRIDREEQRALYNFLCTLFR